MNWIDTLRKKQAELNLIASWASQAGLGYVRDHCRSAAWAIGEEIKRQEEIAATHKAPEVPT